MTWTQGLIEVAFIIAPAAIIAALLRGTRTHKERR